MSAETFAADWMPVSDVSPQEMVRHAKNRANVLLRSGAVATLVRWPQSGVGRARVEFTARHRRGQRRTVYLAEVVALDRRTLVRYTGDVTTATIAETDPRTMLPFFVYGTLRPGWGNSALWRGRGTARHDGEAVLHDYLMTASGVPFIKPHDGGRVIGTIVVPDPEQYADVMEDLDQLEGVAHDFYRRAAVTVETPDGPVRCWVYWSRHEGEVVPGGDFNHYWDEWYRR